MKIIEIIEIGFPKSLIIRQGSLISESIDTHMMIDEINGQLQLKEPKHDCSPFSEKKQFENIICRASGMDYDYH